MTPTPTQARPREGEMLERVARAMLAAHDWTVNDAGENEVVGWDYLTPDWQEAYRKMARAAVEAMRDASPDVVDAGRDVGPDAPYGAHEVRERWITMIDAILAHNTSEERG